MQSFSTIMVFACLFGFFGSWYVHLLMLVNEIETKKLTRHFQVHVDAPSFSRTALRDERTRHECVYLSSSPVAAATDPPSSLFYISFPSMSTSVVGFGLLCNAPGQFITGSIGGYVLQASGGDYGKIAYCTFPPFPRFPPLPSFAGHC